MKRKAEPDPWAVGWTIRALVLIAFVAAFTVPTGLVPIVAVATSASGELTEVEGPIVIPLGTRAPTPTPTPEFTPTPQIPLIGVIAGHTGSDSGAICDDGLREVDINLGIAREVVNLLRAYGWRVELMEEFDARLNGYEADALISIHADSCNVPGKSGFKVARAESSYIPVPEDRLVDCISRHYAEATGLPFDPFTITYDMRRYHAYYEINPNTPAAIIETGFMLDDRALLTERPEVVAQGIVQGLICFVEGEGP
ncbi:MAG: N-acetylmuramoyl-L-alanine amidase [Anaerolineae bacterium]